MFLIFHVRFSTVIIKVKQNSCQCVSFVDSITCKQSILCVIRYLKPKLWNELPIETKKTVFVIAKPLSIKA